MRLRDIPASDDNHFALEAIWLEIRALLKKKKNQVQNEILTYPPPIPACDIQFNHLLEERSRLTEDLRRATAILEKSTDEGDSVRMTCEFIWTCAYIDETQKTVWALRLDQLKQHVDGEEVEERSNNACSGAARCGLV